MKKLWVRLLKHINPSLQIKAIRSPYRFSLRELLNPDPCATWTMPEVNVVSRDLNWSELEIQRLRFFWPIEYDHSELSWLYMEVFSPAISNPHAYEFNHIKINSKEWVIDGGACEGFFTAYALARGACVLAIEPVKRLCEALSLTFKNEISQGRVRILHGCLGKADGTVTIDVNTRSVSTTTIGTGGAYTVRVYTIDTILSRGIIPDVGFIKMDIEGSEIEALIGSKRTLQKNKPRLAIAVYHSLKNAQIAKQMVLTARSDYKIIYRGMYAWEDCIPRPYMLLGS